MSLDLNVRIVQGVWLCWNLYWVFSVHVHFMPRCLGSTVGIMWWSVYKSSSMSSEYKYQEWGDTVAKHIYKIICDGFFFFNTKWKCWRVAAKCLPLEKVGNYLCMVSKCYSLNLSRFSFCWWAAMWWALWSSMSQNAGHIFSAGLARSSFGLRNHVSAKIIWVFSLWSPYLHFSKMYSSFYLLYQITGHNINNLILQWNITRTETYFLISLTPECWNLVQ